MEKKTLPELGGECAVSWYPLARHCGVENSPNRWKQQLGPLPLSLWEHALDRCER